MAKRGADAIPLSRFGVLVAQLESIVASAAQQPPDPLLCFDLLSALVAAIDEEPKESIQLSQRKCEDALYSLLILGARRPVRRLASLAMGMIIAKGDGISIYSRASSLQGWLADSKRSEPLSCAGSGGSGAFAAYSEAFRIIVRVGVSDKSFIVRLAAARCLKTFASIGGPGLGITELENSIYCCVKGLEDNVSSVRDAFAEALGALLALAMNPDAQVKRRGKGQQIPAKKMEDGLQKHLILPFIKASGANAKNLRVGLALSWVFFLQVIHLKYHFPDGELQNYALQAMEILQGNGSPDPHTLACVLYILRVGVADQMIEPTKRNFLVLLGQKLESSDCSPPMMVAILRVLSYLLTSLGEVPAEFKVILDDTIVSSLSHSSLHVRVEAALTLRALAEVDPTCVGGLISYGVATLQALRESVSFDKGNNLQLELNSLHGQATILAALVAISPKLLLGYPSRLPKSVFEVSKKMLSVFSRNPVAAIVEREASWLLLASLIASMPKEELEDQVFDVLLLWAGPFAGTVESYLRHIQDWISELRVLSVALEALTAFIRSFISSTVPSVNGGILLHPVLAYLSGALSIRSSLSSKQLPNIKPALDLFTTRILMAYQSIFDPMAYISEHAQILQICSSPFRDWFEDELRAFDGSKDGILPCVWDKEVCSFPQPESISKMLVNQMLLSFGTIFACQDNDGKLLLLKQIDQCLKAVKKQSWYRNCITNACVGLLSGLKCVLAETDISGAQRRAASEGLGLLARVGNDVFTARMTRSLLGELVAAIDPNYIGGIALTLGCIHRSAGGMALSTLVPATVNSVSQLCKSTNSGIQLWSLHALLLTIEAAGLSFVSQVQRFYSEHHILQREGRRVGNIVAALATLFLAMEILLSDENGYLDLRQEIGHLINAIVAVLGPELSPGSTFFSRCKSAIAEISSCKETATLVESVRFTQQLVLFAPQAVPVHSHVESLLPTLSSRQPSLRHLAVSTLRHLIEKDPVALIDEKIEENLFAMLDEETDSENCPDAQHELHDTRLLSASLQKQHQVIPDVAIQVIATSVRSLSSSGNEHLNAGSENDTTLYYGEDDENMIASSSGEQKQGPAFKISDFLRRSKHLRYRTRISTGQFEGMQPIGVKLLSIIMDKFGKTPDPEFPGHILLEQYQAQLVSAVRSAISTASGPLLLDAGLELATKNNVPDEYLQLTPLLANSSTTLGKFWIGILKDYSYICFGLNSKYNYKPFLDGIQSLLVSSKVQKCLDESWPLILQATALDAVPVEFEMDNSVVYDAETLFLSGRSMVKLERSEFQLLWGLSLLVLFQEQETTVNKPVNMLLAHNKFQQCRDILIAGNNDLKPCEIVLPVLIYADCSSSIGISLLVQIIQSCPDDFFEVEAFVLAAMELLSHYLIITFLSVSSAACYDYLCRNSQDISNGSLLSELSMAAEKMAYRTKYKNIAPFLRKCFKESELNDEHTHQKAVLEAWTSMLAFVSKDCIRKLCSLENKMSSSYKLLAKILVFCLEEAISLSKLIHEAENLRRKETTGNSFMFAIFNQCTECVHNTIHETNIEVETVIFSLRCNQLTEFVHKQVQKIGLHVLKTVAQKELAEGSHKKNSSFLFFAGEILEDVFLLTQNTLKSTSRESITIIDECLRLLFLIHTLGQETKCQQAVAMLLLDALLMAFSLSRESNSKDLIEVNTITRRLVSHLVQIPSAATQIKDVMLSVPVTRRQQLQDMIRASVTQGQTTMQANFGVQSETKAVGEKPQEIQGRKEEKDENDDNDEDDDWDAFQSLPADNTPTADSATIADSSPVDDNSSSSPYHSNMSYFGDYEEVADAKETATGVDEKAAIATSVDKTDLKEPSPPKYSDSNEILESGGNIQEISNVNVCSESKDRTTASHHVDDATESFDQLLQDDEQQFEVKQEIHDDAALKPDDEEPLEEEQETHDDVSLISKCGGDGAESQSNDILASAKDNEEESNDPLPSNMGSEESVLDPNVKLNEETDDLIGGELERKCDEGEFGGQFSNEIVSSKDQEDCTNDHFLNQGNGDEPESKCEGDISGPSSNSPSSPNDISKGPSNSPRSPTEVVDAGASILLDHNPSIAISQKSQSQFIRREDSPIHDECARNCRSQAAPQHRHPLFSHTPLKAIHNAIIPLEPHLRLNPRFHHVQRVATHPARHSGQPPGHEHRPETLLPGFPTPWMKLFARKFVSPEVDTVGRSITEDRNGEPANVLGRAQRTQAVAAELEADLDELNGA
ncbi:HEAT repeat-containing protein 5A [Ananas comosus]|uniref:HEAT repeat-containing protein 5A n=1 Tax=Ananas comosus TaxID=4615 RepID=A0A199W2B4_ANACO|nr:HEAT repeat-containing protein 5A [Ananas comosus]